MDEIRKIFYPGDIFFDIHSEMNDETSLKCLQFTECEGGTFGQDCTEVCGNCLGGESCHHINGSCLNGCDSGYEKIYCTKGYSIYTYQ